MACDFIKKEILAQVFSCEFYEISKNTFFHRTSLVAASDLEATDFTKCSFGTSEIYSELIDAFKRPRWNIFKNS